MTTKTPDPINAARLYCVDTNLIKYRQANIINKVAEV